MNYNTDPVLLANLRASILDSRERPRLQIVDGHFFAGSECISRFTDDAHALLVLKEAGFTVAERNEFRIILKA